MKKVKLFYWNKNAWGYIPQKNKFKDFVFKRVGHPHPYGRLRAMKVISLVNPKLYTLDAGCGEGVFSRELVLGGVNIVGMDIDQHSLDCCKVNSSLLKINYPIIKGDIENIPFEPNSFDQLIITDVLEHVNNIEVALDEVNRVLKKTGSLIISVPTPLYLHESILPVNFDKQLKEIGHVSHGWYFEEIKSILEKKGFVILSNTYFGKGITRLIMELIYYFVGAEGIKKNKKKMYGFNLSTLFSFLLISPFLFLDRFYKNKKGAFLVVKCTKIN